MVISFLCRNIGHLALGNMVRRSVSTGVYTPCSPCHADSAPAAPRCAPIAGQPCTGVYIPGGREPMAARLLQCLSYITFCDYKICLDTFFNDPLQF